jgi:hypothetical protein
MKVMADMYFETKAIDGGDINTTRVFTYLLYDRDKNIDIIGSHGERVGAKQIMKYRQGKLTLTDQTIAPGKPYVTGTSADGNTLYVDAEYVEIEGTLDVASGYKAEVRAQAKIKVLSASRVKPNIRLMIKEDFYNFPKIEEVSQSELTAFCKGNNKKYKANEASSPYLPNDKPEKTHGPTHEQFAISLFPNPSDDKVTVQLTDELTQTVQIGVYDMMGNSVILEQEESRNGISVYQIDIKHLAKGIYILKVQNSDGTKAIGERLVKY